MAKIIKLRFKCVHGCQFPGGIRHKGDIVEVTPDQLTLPAYWRLKSKASFRQMSDDEVVIAPPAPSAEIEGLKQRLKGMNVQFDADATLEQLLDKFQSAAKVFTGADAGAGNVPPVVSGKEALDNGAGSEGEGGSGALPLPTPDEIAAMDRDALKAALKELQEPFAHNTGDDKLRSALSDAVAARLK